jgi:hypothetical protein
MLQNIPQHEAATIRRHHQKKKSPNHRSLSLSPPPAIPLRSVHIIYSLSPNPATMGHVETEAEAEMSLLFESSAFNEDTAREGGGSVAGVAGSGAREENCPVLPSLVFISSPLFLSSCTHTEEAVIFFCTLPLIDWLVDPSKTPNQ